MNFLKKLFGGGKQADSNQSIEKKNPENTRLIYLLDIWASHQSDQNYKAVVDEIENGNGFLLLLSRGNANARTEWYTVEEGGELTIGGIFDQDGLRTLAAFTDEQALLAWLNQSTEYISMGTRDVIDMCRAQGIGRIVINHGQKNMFVLERNLQHITSIEIQEKTRVLIGTPNTPLSPAIIEKLVNNFRLVNTIEEAYQYAQSMNNETSIVLGIVMSVVSEESQFALRTAISNALENEELKMPVDAMVLSPDMLQSVSAIENSLFYKRTS
ncbi:MAG TPA: SseB family protein [Flavipsychrobacter sp.]